MQEMFYRLGLPKSLWTDNGRQYESKELKDFCKENNIELFTTPPYWPQANWAVENMNRSLEKHLKITHANKSKYELEIQKFLLM